MPGVTDFCAYGPARGYSSLFCRARDQQSPSGKNTVHSHILSSAATPDVYSQVHGLLGKPSTDLLLTA